MNFIEKNFKKANIFNMVMIVITILLSVYTVIQSFDLEIEKYITLFNIFGLLVGLMYSYSGYKKSVAIYYKGFMIFYVISLFKTAVGAYYAVNLNGYSVLLIFEIIKVVSVIALAFVKNLGRKKSYVLALLVLICTIISIIGSLASFGINLVSLVSSLNELLLACIVCVLVCGKYIDKTSRGAE